MLYSLGSQVDAALRATLCGHIMQMQGEGEVYTLIVAAIYRGTRQAVAVAKSQWLSWRVLWWESASFKFQLEMVANYPVTAVLPSESVRTFDRLSRFDETWLLHSADMQEQRCLPWAAS